jgi:hypothetical protein
MNSMNLIELGRITSDDGESFQYLCNKFKDLSCPNCEQQVYYFMSRQRLRCKICGRDFRADFTQLPLIFVIISLVESISAW